jgi:hypothetical protein
MTPDPSPIIDAARFVRYFEAEALVPVIVASVVSIGLSAIWLAAVMSYLRLGNTDRADSAH